MTFVEQLNKMRNDLYREPIATVAYWCFVVVCVCVLVRCTAKEVIVTAKSVYRNLAE